MSFYTATFSAPMNRTTMRAELHKRKKTRHSIESHECMRQKELAQALNPDSERGAHLKQIYESYRDSDRLVDPTLPLGSFVKATIEYEGLCEKVRTFASKPHVGKLDDHALVLHSFDGRYYMVLFDTSEEGTKVYREAMEKEKEKLKTTSEEDSFVPIEETPHQPL